MATFEDKTAHDRNPALHEKVQPCPGCGNITVCHWTDDHTPTGEIAVPCRKCGGTVMFWFGRKP